MKKSLLIFGLMIMVLGLTAYTQAQDHPSKGEHPKKAALGDIVDIAAANPDFSTLVKALKAAGLVDTLKGEGPFTVFAPTNAAFDKLPKGTLEKLLADIPALKNILLYHVVPGKVMAADVVKVDSAKTALGEAINVKVDGDKVMVNNAQVIKTDIKASNGVIHVIDTVILPPSK